jgi:hypothetical protein
MIRALRLAGIVITLLLCTFTALKLVKMSRIRGILPGPDPQVKQITDKAVLPGRYGDAYWVAWDSVDISLPTPYRMNLSVEVWKRYERGDSIELLYFPGDVAPYHREDIFASNGNLAFEGVLFALWISSFVTLILLEFRASRCGGGRKRRSRRGSRDTPGAP